MFVFYFWFVCDFYLLSDYFVISTMKRYGAPILLFDLFSAFLLLLLLLRNWQFLATTVRSQNISQLSTIVCLLLFVVSCLFDTLFTASSISPNSKQFWFYAILVRDLQFLLEANWEALQWGDSCCAFIHTFVFIEVN